MMRHWCTACALIVVTHGHFRMESDKSDEMNTAEMNLPAFDLHTRIHPDSSVEVSASVGTAGQIVIERPQTKGSKNGTKTPDMTGISSEDLAQYAQFAEQSEQFNKRIGYGAGLISEADATASGHNDSPRICVVMRTCPRDSLALRVSLLSLCNAQAQQADGYYRFHFFVVNTDPKMDDSFISAAEQEVASSPCAGSMTKLSFPNATKPDPKMYGYDRTNQAFDQIFAREETPTFSDCAYFLTTNSDNMYNEHLLENTGKLLRAGRDLVCFDFVTNHERAGHQQRQTISVALKRASVDLGSCFMSSQAVMMASGSEKGHTTLYSPDWYAADWNLIEKIVNRVPSDRVALVHEVLQIHQ